MRKIFAILATCAGIMVPVICQGAVRWLGTTHDFGAFKEDDGKVTCQFKFVNDGPDAVSIRAARASCGCTAPSFTKTPIEAGDTGVVTVKFNPTGRPGRFSKSVTMDLAGEGKIPRQTLVIRGVVIGSSNTLRSRYPVEAGSVKLRTTQLPFGTVLKGKAKSAFLEVYNASEAPVSPKWDGVPEYIRIASSDGGEIPPGEQAVYSFVLTPGATALYGILTDSVFMNVGNDKPLKIDLTAILEEDFSRLTPGERQKAPSISLAADRVNLGEIAADGCVVSGTFTIANHGKSDLMLRRIYTIDPGVTVYAPSDKVKKGKTTEVTITVDPSKLPGDLLNARIQVITNDPENPIVIVRAVGEVRNRED